LLECCVNNDVRYRLFPTEEVFLTTFSGVNSYYNGREIYIVSHMTEFRLRVFIDKKTYGIIHVEYENSLPEDLAGKWIDEKDEGLRGC